MRVLIVPVFRLLHSCDCVGFFGFVCLCRCNCALDFVACCLSKFFSQLLVVSHCFLFLDASVIVIDVVFGRLGYFQNCLKATDICDVGCRYYQSGRGALDNLFLVVLDQDLRDCFYLIILLQKSNSLFSHHGD